MKTTFVSKQARVQTEWSHVTKHPSEIGKIIDDVITTSGNHYFSIRYSNGDCEAHFPEIVEIIENGTPNQP